MLPLLVVLFVPLLFGVSDLYLWARPRVVATGCAVAAPVSECALFLVRDWRVLCGLAGRGIFLEPLVSPARPGAGAVDHALPATSPAAAQRGRPGALWAHGDLCGDRLDDVPGAPLVLDDLWYSSLARDWWLWPLRL